MKFGSIVPCLLLWVSTFNFAQAQTEPVPVSKPKSRLYLSDLYIQSGIVHQGLSQMSLADYRQLAPQSTLLKDDFTSLQQNSFGGYRGYQRQMGTGLFSMLAGINFANKPNWQMRVGFTTFRDDVGYESYGKSITKTYDTLVSAQTGRQYFMDSTQRTSYSMSHSRRQMRLEASLVYRTDPERRWGFYAGLGASVFFTLNSQTDITYNQFTGFQERSGNLYISRLDNNDFRRDIFKSESFRNKNTVGYTFFAPIGIDFRVGKKHSVWSRVHFLYEMRPTLVLSKTSLTDLRGNLNFQQNMGLRFVFSK